MPANYDTDEAKVDYKRSLQLVSSYQRTNRKLKDRFEKLQKTTKELKKNARILLGVCKSMKDEAHESDPDYVEPVPKVVPKPNPVGEFLFSLLLLSIFYIIFFYSCRTSGLRRVQQALQEKLDQTAQTSMSRNWAQPFVRRMRQVLRIEK